MSDTTNDTKRVFFPLALIPAHEQELVLYLFDWCESHEIDVCHCTDSIGQIQIGSVLSPDRGGPQLATIQLFYGACDNKEAFEKLFDRKYDIKKAHEIPNFVMAILNNLVGK